jgi:hypothetical protein
MILDESKKPLNNQGLFRELEFGVFLGRDGTQAGFIGYLILSLVLDILKIQNVLKPSESKNTQLPRNNTNTALTIKKKGPG